MKYNKLELFSVLYLLKKLEFRYIKTVKKREKFKKIDYNKLAHKKLHILLSESIFH